MTNDKTNTGGTQPANPAAHPAPGPAVPLKRLFRTTDWVTFLITFAVVWIGYYLTLAPELTLEDSGELATGSFYAGIPHPPGYPVWTIYTWLWTVLLPIKNIAWRVALGEATGGALAAGLLGLLVSRGSSLLMEGIEELKGIPSRWESAICTVAGFVAGTLIGFNGFMWSQSVIVEVYSFSVASFMVVLLCLLRWIYAPMHRRYLYWAMFFFGLCFTNHQTLIVAAMGIEVAIAAADFRMGRQLFLGNSIIYLCGLILKQQHFLTALEANPAILVIFHVVGVASIAAYVWFTFLTKETFSEFCMDASMAGFFLLASVAPAWGFFGWLLAAASLAAFAKFVRDTRKLGWEWLVVIICGVCWLGGAAFYFYMPLAGMSNPPMQWGYPRTAEGFVHAFTRGQYEKANPSNIIGDPLRFLTQLSMLGTGIIEEFNWVYAFIALVPFLFFFKLHRRERAWLIGIIAIYLCLGVLLLILLNPPPDRAAQELVRVFFTASHTLIALLVGYGLTLVAAYMATHYERFRSWGLIGGAVAAALALYSLTYLTEKTFFGEGASAGLSDLFQFIGGTLTNKDQYGLPVYAGLILVGMTLAFLGGLWLYRKRAPLALTLVLFAIMPLHSVMTHWSDNEQNNHWFGYWFGHDMFTPPFAGSDGKPLYPEMTKDAILYGGTDPGRFCPTYMIFCDSFLEEECQPKFDTKFDRRDVYIITQNALADGTYLNYIRAHYNRSTQIDPPFFQEFLRSEQERRENYATNFLARAVAPLDRFFTGLGDRIEKRRRTYTSWFRESHFTNLPAFCDKLRPGPRQDALSKFLWDNLSPETRNLLTSPANSASLRTALARDLNRLLERELGAGKEASGEKQAAAQPLYDPERFKHVQLSEYLQDFIKQNPRSHTRIRLNRLLLEAAYPAEIGKTKGGVYPDREMYIASADDSQNCFTEYLADAQRRLELNQLKAGEDVKVANGRVQVSGQVAVMNINGLLTKVMFDHNPKNEFFVEESFPLDWMFPHLTPYGIIMKINRQPLAEFTEDIIKRDHEFWSRYSERLIGNWITYDTSIKDIAAFVEKVYLRRNFQGFKGDRRFVRDDQAQKAFSKLRSSIGGVYAWRVAMAKPGSADQQRMAREADFVFRQAFAFCPYSPEAVFRYTNLLLSMQRFDDALLIATTCLKLDPYNASVLGLINQLKTWKSQGLAPHPVVPGLEQAEKAAEANPSDFQAMLNLAAACMQAQQPGRALEVLDRVLNNPQADANVFRALIQAYASMNQKLRLQEIADKLDKLYRANPSNLVAGIAFVEACRQLAQNDRATQILDQMINQPQVDANTLLQAAQQYAQLGNLPKLETTLERVTRLVPNSPEAWYDLAALKAALGKTAEVVPALRRAIDSSAARRKLDPNARDIAAEAQKDGRFSPVRETPEFKQLFGPK